MHSSIFRCHIRPATHTLIPGIAERLARLVLGCIHREYPNHLLHALESDADVRPPRELTPAFFGSFDWHSAVHGHWSLVRLWRTAAAEPAGKPTPTWVTDARAAVGKSLSPDNLAAELAYLAPPLRAGFERPYGLAWLLQLHAELHEEFAETPQPDTAAWLSSLQPLVELSVRRISEWVVKLTHPIRSGEHSQTAFAFGLAIDWARTVGDTKFEQLLCERSVDFHGKDRKAPILYEPSGHDFLSPCLAEADLMGRILLPPDFANWLTEFLPDACQAQWLKPAACGDRSDGKLAHLDGLNLSRSWMLEGIAAALQETDPRQAILMGLASEHAAAGLPTVTGEHYAGGHWLGTFAIYLLTRRGIRTSA